MKKLVVLLLASLIATSAFAVIDPDPDMIGIYFDTNADVNSKVAVPNVPFFAYLIATNPTPANINAYELGMLNVVPEGMEGMVFRLGSYIADNVVSGVDVGVSGPLGGDHIVGLAEPLVTTPATILHSWQFMVLAEFPMDMYIFQSSAPSIDDVYPVLQNADGSILYTVGQSTGGPDIPVAGVNSEGAIAVEEASFGSVKSLFR